MENSTFLASDYEKEQIDAIKKILRVYFSGDIEFSKNFSELKPNIDNQKLKEVLNELDENINRDDLIRYVNDINIMAYNEENKLCFMYDAKNYGFCIEKWINKCDSILSNSSSDLQNAIYSTMLDICCEEMGILVVRICEGDFDWTDEHAMEKLNEIVSNIRKGDFC